MKKAIRISSLILLVFALYAIAIFSPSLILHVFPKSTIGFLIVPFGLLTGMSLLYLLVRISWKKTLPTQSAKEVEMFTKEEEHLNVKRMRIG